LFLDVDVLSSSAHVLKKYINVTAVAISKKWDWNIQINHIIDAI
jgi:hypothetical protein